MSDEKSRGARSAQDARWRRDSDITFTLIVGGQAAAHIDLLDNTAMIMRDLGATNRMAIPDSRSAFDVVEAHLGTGRIEKWEGHDASDRRSRADEVAARFREAVPAGQEPQHYLSSAWKWLDQAAHERELGAEGRRAHDNVRAALREVTIHGHWTRQAEAHAARALAALDSADPRRLSHAERQAGTDCAKAEACIRARQSDHSFTRAIMSAARKESQREDRSPDRERD